MVKRVIYNPLNGQLDYVDVTLSSDITSTVLTGFVSGAGSVTNADTIETSIEKLDGNVKAVASTVLSGFVSAAGTVTSSDTIESAIEKIDGNTNTLGAKYVRTTRFVSLGAGTSGTISIPANNTIILDDFGGTVDAVVCPISGGRPDTGNLAFDTNGLTLAATLDVGGNWTLSGTAASYPVALVYRTRVPLTNHNDTDSDIIGGTEVVVEEAQRWNRVQVTSAMSPYTPTQWNHTIFAVDLSGGSVVFNLPEVTAANQGTDLKVYVEIESGSNTLTVNTYGAQTVQGRTSHSFRYRREGFNLVAHYYSTYHWDVVAWITDTSAGKANYEEGRTGFVEWYDAGNYYSLVGTTFTLLRGGRGFIRGQEIIWASGQTFTVSTNELSRAAIDRSGILQKRTAWNVDTDGSDYISLFEIFYDALSNAIVTRANFEYSTDHGARVWVARGFGAVVGPIQYGTADLSRYTTGSGGVSTDRQLNIAAGALIEGDLLDTWSAVSTGITISFAYINGSGQSVLYVTQKEVPMVYVSAGAITSLGAGSYGVFRVYLAFSDLNTSPPRFTAEVHTAQFANITSARTAINNGTISGVGVYNPRVAQIGYVIVHNSGGGYIADIVIAKKTLTQFIGAGAVSSAASINAATTNFNNILSASDTTVQQALDTLDDLAHNSTTSKQGGTTAEYYHLTSAQHTIATQAATDALAGYMSIAAQSFIGTKTWEAVAGTATKNLYRINGSLVSPTKIVSGNVISTLNFGGQYDTTVGNVTPGAAIVATATADWASATNCPTKIEFKTATAAAAPTTRLTIDSDGSVTASVSGTTMLSTTTTGCRLKGNSSGSAAASGEIGEIVSGSTDAATTLAATNTVQNLCTIALTKGVWLISARCVLDPSGITLSRLQTSITGTGSSTIDGTLGLNQNEGAYFLSSGYVMCECSFAFTCDGDRTYYCNSRTFYTGTSSGNVIRFVARAVRVG